MKSDKLFAALIVSALIGIPAWTLVEVINMKAKIAVIEYRLGMKATYEPHETISLSQSH